MSDNQVIPDEAVEAAAKVLAPSAWGPRVWTYGAPGDRYTASIERHRQESISRARAALEAAVPHMLAEEVTEQDDRVGWHEFIKPGAATTHIAYVHEGGSIYLPEGPDAVTEQDFQLASATNRFWRLIRA